jgi:hypothetical protein
MKPVYTHVGHSLSHPVVRCNEHGRIRVAPAVTVLVAFAPDENPTAAHLEKSIAKTMKKAAVKHKTPVGRPTPSPPVDKPPLLRPETAPM